MTAGPGFRDRHRACPEISGVYPGVPGFLFGFWLGNVWICRCQTFNVFPIFLAFEG